LLQNPFFGEEEIFPAIIGRGYFIIDTVNLVNALLVTAFQTVKILMFGVVSDHKKVFGYNIFGIKDGARDQTVTFIGDVDGAVCLEKSGNRGVVELAGTKQVGCDVGAAGRRRSLEELPGFFLLFCER